LITGTATTFYSSSSLSENVSLHGFWGDIEFSVNTSDDNYKGDFVISPTKGITCTNKKWSCYNLKFYKITTQYSDITVASAPLSSLTITPSTASQAFSPASSFYGYGDITVNPMVLSSLSVTPTESQQTFGSGDVLVANVNVLTATSANTYTAVDFSGFSVGDTYRISGSWWQGQNQPRSFNFTGTWSGNNIEFTLSSSYSYKLTVSPTNGITFNANNYSCNINFYKVTGIDGYSDVTVGAIPSGYVGTGITQQSAANLTASGSTVTVPAGYYSSQVTKNVTGGVVIPPTSITGTGATITVGTNTLTFSKAISVTPNVTTAGYISSGTSGNATV